MSNDLGVGLTYFLSFSSLSSFFGRSRGWFFSGTSSHSHCHCAMRRLRRSFLSLNPRCVLESHMAPSACESHPLLSVAKVQHLMALRSGSRSCPSSACFLLPAKPTICLGAVFLGCVPLVQIEVVYLDSGLAVSDDLLTPIAAIVFLHGALILFRAHCTIPGTNGCAPVWCFSLASRTLIKCLIRHRRWYQLRTIRSRSVS